MTTERPEALRLASDIAASGQFTNLFTLDAAAAELRTQQARITALESQLAQRFDAADMATASAQGFRDGVASLSANAREPVYQARYQKGFWQDSSRERNEYLQNPENTCAEDWETRILYTRPPTAQAEGWTKLPGQLPEPGMPVLLDIGKKYPIRAMWAAKHTVQAADDDTDWGEYVEEDDMYYAPEGWYEWNQCEDNHWRVTETPRAWMPLPPTSAEGVEHG